MALRYLLDTSTLVQLLRRGGSERVATRLKSVGPGDAAICSIVRLELLHGAHRRPDPEAALALMEAFLAGLPSIPFDDAVADHGARIRVALTRAGTPIGPYDLLIAATAAAHNLAVVTGNVGEFARVPGLTVENWLAD